MSLEISTATFLHWKLHQHLSAQLKCPALEISTDIFLSQPKCRWKFPSTFFSVTAKMSLEISSDIFSHSQNVAGNFHRHFSSLETSPTFIGTVEMSGAGNFHGHFSLTAKMSLEISIDIFSVTAEMSLEISTDIFFHSQSAAENFHRHFFSHS